MARPMTFEQIGAELGISGRLARQICEKALRKITRKNWKTLCEMRERAIELRRDEFSVNGRRTPRRRQCE